ncbi:ABC transporter ATP-binding protein [Actinokineospora sp.]|uniref:ABC transporter ATP-binding protein n=1 Tax=Actinokineospora sp. TaxID=1872133 RepID=UPI004037C69A
MPTGVPGLIQVAGLTKSFGAVKAVDDMSFTVEPGSIAGFLGPNGAGKTTTLRILLGLIRPDSGRATIGGLPYADIARPNDEVGAALEASGFHPARSGRDHLRIYCTVNGYPRTRADEVLETVGLTAAARRAVRGYSLGMRQRLALATALLGRPRVLVLDEPANGLDPEGIAWMRRLLRGLADEGSTVLVSSHVLSEVRQLVDQVVIINSGRLVRQCALDDLADSGHQVVSVRTPQAADLLDALSRDGLAGERVDPRTVRVSGASAERVGGLAFRAGIELHGLHAEGSDLEQVFFALTGDSAPTPAASTSEVS